MNPNVTIDGMQGRITDSGVVDFRADDRVNVNFYRKSVPDPEKSRTAGRPIFVSKDYVRIQQPGEKDYVDRPVSDDPSVQHRWPHHWARYQQNQEQVPTGTPVEMLFPSTPEIPANLHQLGVHTVEQLANLTSEGLSQVGMGATQWQQQAKSYIAKAKDGVGHHQMTRALEVRDNKIEVLTNQVATLTKQIDLLLAEKQGVPSAMIPRAPVPFVPPGQLPASAFGPEEDGDAPVEAAGVVDPASAGAVDAMKRQELFAYLAARGISCSVPITNDELRAKARAAGPMTEAA